MKRAIIPVTLIILLEFLVYRYSGGITTDELYFYQLAARYSARISFFLLVAVLLWMGLAGLRKIFASERNRENYVILLLLLMINHVIHFGFLLKNYMVNNMSLMEARNLVGVAGYLAITLMPFYLWKQKKLTKRLYLGIYTFLMGITFIFTFSYIDRLSKKLPFGTPKQYFIISLAVLAGMLLLNSYRVLEEGRQRKSSDI